MTKKEFVSQITPLLASLNYQRKNSYWYKYHNNLIYCIAVCGSQWDRGDYYVEIGVTSLTDCTFKKPSLLKWNIRYRCVDEDCNDKNIDITIFSKWIKYFQQITTVEQMEKFAQQHKVVQLSNQTIVDFTEAQTLLILTGRS